MTRAVAHWSAPEATPRARRPALWLVQTPPVTRRRLLASWQRALDAAAAAAESAVEVKAFDEAWLKDANRGLRDERLWLARFVRDSAARFP